MIVNNFMSRTYRFFTRHLLPESLEQSLGSPFHLGEKLEPEIFFQLSKVLRVKVGDKVVLLPSAQGAAVFEYHYVVGDVQKREIILRLEQKSANENELDFELGLILCLPNKPDKLEFILQKAVEIGAIKIILVEGEFSQMKHNLRLDRLQKILSEAAEQSERAVIPGLEIAGKLSNYLSGLSADGRSNVAVAMERMEESNGDESGVKKGAAKFLQIRTGATVHILIGPEGGFSENEKSLIPKLGLRTFSLGKRILRMETAAILALGMASMSLPHS